MIKLHPLFYITPNIQTLIIYIYSSISDPSHTRARTDTPLFLDIEQAYLFQKSDSSLLTFPRPPIIFRNDSSHSSLFSFRVILPYIVFLCTYLYPVQIFPLYDQHFSAPIPTNIQRRKLQHTFHFTHASHTYTHTSFCSSLTTNNVPLSVQSYEHLASLSRN